LGCRLEWAVAADVCTQRQGSQYIDLPFGLFFISPFQVQILAGKIIAIARYTKLPFICGVDSALDFTRATNRDKSGLKGKE
jgi:hypothetical protein